MKLWTINRVLRRIGLVLVVSTDLDGVEDTEFWIERASTYDKRTSVLSGGKPPVYEPWIDKLPNDATCHRRRERQAPPHRIRGGRDDGPAGNGNGEQADTGDGHRGGQVSEVTDVRLCATNKNDKLLESGLGPVTTVRLADVGSGHQKPFAVADDLRPALLVSFHYLRLFERNRSHYHFRDWVMDSGAFSAHMSGVSIDLAQYTETCRKYLAEDPSCTEVFALDVIGDSAASLKNAEAMWKAGVPAIPTYHHGEPESALLEMSRQYPKIALGGVARKRLKEKNAWAQQCFARVWPKPLHGFGFGAPESILTMPFHSVDASNWEMGPSVFGQWRSYGGAMSVRAKNIRLRREVEHYLDIERRARVRWAGELAKLKYVPRRVA